MMKFKKKVQPIKYQINMNLQIKDKGNSTNREKT